MLGQVGHHLPEVGETERLLGDFVFLGSEFRRVRLSAANILNTKNAIQNQNTTDKSVVP